MQFLRFNLDSIVRYCIKTWVLFLNMEDSGLFPWGIYIIWDIYWCNFFWLEVIQTTDCSMSQEPRCTCHEEYMQKYYYFYKIMCIYLHIHKYLGCVNAQLLSCVWLFEAPWNVVHQALLSMGLFRQKYWSGLPFPPLGGLLDPGTKTVLSVDPALAGRFFTTEPTEKPHI